MYPLDSNVWGPHRQPDLVDVLGKHYKFSPRLQAIIQSSPPQNQIPAQEKDTHVSRFSSSSRRPKKDDVEIALTSSELQLPKAPSATSSDPPVPPARSQNHELGHYTLAEQMQNYHALDVGRHCKDILER